MKQINKKRFYSLILFSLVLLINPNINLIDIMPDFVAWFILARLFERAADSAPYFDEAQAAFKKLAWLNLAKIPGFLLIMLVRSKDTLDNNIYTLMSVSFATLEAIFLISAVKNIFNALFHLGERTSAVALISPFASLTSKRRSISPDMLKDCTYFFLICKTALYFLPDMFLLTSVTDKGHIVTASKYYPYVFLFSQALCIFIGVIWFLRIRKYISAVHKEGLFFEALASMASEDSEMRYETKTKLRSILSVLSLMSVTSLFTVELSFNNWSGINILPHFIYGILLCISLYFLNNNSKVNKLSFLFGGCFTVSSAISYILSVNFLSKYQYLDLLDTAAARSKYISVQISSLIEFILLAVFLVFVAKSMNNLIISHTGISPESERYQRMEKDYHSTLKKKNYILMSLGIFAGAAKCINVFLKREVQIFINDYDSVIVASAIPWFDLIVTASAVAYIGFSIYFLSALKEEIKLKYTG